jgi:hypothetical protein
MSYLIKGISLLIIFSKFLIMLFKLFKVLIKFNFFVQKAGWVVGE